MLHNRNYSNKYFMRQRRPRKTDGKINGYIGVGPSFLLGLSIATLLVPPSDDVIIRYNGVALWVVVSSQGSPCKLLPVPAISQDCIRGKVHVFQTTTSGIVKRTSQVSSCVKIFNSVAYRTIGKGRISNQLKVQAGRSCWTRSNNCPRDGQQPSGTGTRQSITVHLKRLPQNPSGERFTSIMHT